MWRDLLAFPPMQSPIVNIPLAEILTVYRPTDMLDSAGPDETRPRVLWTEVFASIERNHAAFSPAKWRKFCASVCKRQREPIRVLRGKQSGQPPVVVNGHHRVWALAKGGKTRARVLFGD